MARLSDTAFGRLLRDHAQAEGIDLAAAPHAAEPTTLAVVGLDATAQASYDFYVEGTADWQWTDQETGAGACVKPPSCTSDRSRRGPLRVTPGSSTSPGPRATAVTCWSATTPTSGPGSSPITITAVVAIERAVRLAHLVKASADDLAWLYPGLTLDEVAKRWLGLGATVVVITRSASGADAYTSGGLVLHRPARDVIVVDTVGAGDSFTAGLIASLIRRDRHAPARLAQCPADQLAGALDDAILVASINCQRRGNDPPTLADLAAAG